MNKQNRNEDQESIMSEEKKQIAVGGQAVIEGVMMRGPNHIATAIRRKDGTIEVKKEEFISVTKKNKILGLPVIRGFVSLIEMMKIGMATLSFSIERNSLDIEEEEKKRKSSKKLDGDQKPAADAEVQPEQKPEKNRKAGGIWDKFTMAFSMIIAFALALLFFGVLPYKSAEWLNLSEEAVLFNMFAGIMRIVLFLVYLLLISLIKDIRRVFEYHGAEHKAVFAYEKDEKLLAENIRKYSTFHPRCGTSFMFFVLLLSILVFSVVDTLVILSTGAIPNTLIRLLYHIPFIPFISGISYEVLKLSGKKMNSFLVKFLIAPGLGLQRITTKQPDDNQIEMAVVALKAALELDLSDKQITWIK
jgi:uncharacterized protein YqhQ